MRIILYVRYLQWVWCHLYMVEQDVKKKIWDSKASFEITREFAELCKEETLMVRRAVASKIGEIA